MDSAVKDLVDIIWQQGGFRFSHHDTRANYSYRYYCVQDKAREKKSNQKHRDFPRMERFDCRSKLLILPCLDSRTLFLSMYHEHHDTYDDKRLSDATLAFINERIESLPPADIFRDLQTSTVPGSESATMEQVYYRYALCLYS